MSVLEFIAALKWPVTVLAILAVAVRGLKKHPGAVRRLVGYLEKRDVRGKAGPVEFEAVTTAAVERAVEVTAASDQELTAMVAGTDPVTPDGAIPADPSLIRRDAVEDLMQTSARWGWEMAKVGLQSPPRPHVVWSEGRPLVMFGIDAPFEHLSTAHVPTRLTAEELRRRAAEAPQPEIGDEARQEAIRRRIGRLRREREDQ